MITDAEAEVLRPFTDTVIALATGAADPALYILVALVIPALAVLTFARD